MTTRERGHGSLPHTADVGIEAHGRSLEEAFAEAVVALSDLLTGGAHVAPLDSVEAIIEGPDEEALLVGLLEECLYQLDAHAWIVSMADVEVGRGALHATLHGEPLDRERHGGGVAVKAITWHRLQVRRCRDGVELNVYVDV